MSLRDDLELLIYPTEDGPPADLDWLALRGFRDVPAGAKRLQRLARQGKSSPKVIECLARLLFALDDAPSADTALLNFERFVEAQTDPSQLYAYLVTNPRAVEILTRLFAGSQYLTETLLKAPDSLDELTSQRRIAEVRSRVEFLDLAFAALDEGTDEDSRLAALKRFQRREILRIGASDIFGLADLKTITAQLSMLADAIVESCWRLVNGLGQGPRAGFCVLAFGKLGGEELNYSSDIDLVFLGQPPSQTWQAVAQKLIRALSEATNSGFLYRVDMRLRPWGRAGELVSTPDSYAEYLRKHAAMWEKQALLKARPIAGDTRLGRQVLRQIDPIIFDLPADEVRIGIRESKDRIEMELSRRGKSWGEVKSGQGSIRDIEFITQYLQLVNGKLIPAVRSPQTVDALIRLADHDILHADEYRQLSSGYVFLRTIEHALQLLHNKQEHSLPKDRAQLDYLARRLDFPTGDQLLVYYEQHCGAVRRIFDRHLGESARLDRQLVSDQAASKVANMGGLSTYQEVFSEPARQRHLAAFAQIQGDKPTRVFAEELPGGSYRVEVLGVDHPGLLSMICGLLFVYGFNIESGHAFSAVHGSTVLNPMQKGSTGKKRGITGHSTVERDFIDEFVVRPLIDVVLPEVWGNYESDLNSLIKVMRASSAAEAQGELAKRVANALGEPQGSVGRLSPVNISLSVAPDESTTLLRIQADDSIGFLYEMTNALALCQIDIRQMVIRLSDGAIDDLLLVTDARTGGPITELARRQQLQAAIVLIKHFTHLLPTAPNPEAALLHFRTFLQELFEQPNWAEKLASLERPEMLTALAQLLGVSDFLWEDFLRLQHANLFPVLTDLDGLKKAKSATDLATELRAELSQAASITERQDALNAFKDREMFRVDMRHILGHSQAFGDFSRELTDIAEVVVREAVELVQAQLVRRHGHPRLPDGALCPVAVCALGKFGGRELGFASDIELMFVYGGDGRTDGKESLDNASYMQRFVDAFTQAIRAREDGIFHVDLRLRPYGRAGTAAVTPAAFDSYFETGGPAWPYERQALVKLRPVAGDTELGQQLVTLRNRILYSRHDFDFAAMRAIREKQVRQLVAADTINAKLSPGGLVDSEYLAQALQILHAHAHAELHTTNTREAIAALHELGIISDAEETRWKAAHRFHRQLIDALRMVRGDARDLTIPAIGTDELDFLARRMSYTNSPAQIFNDFETHATSILELLRKFSGDAAGSPV